METIISVRNIEKSYGSQKVLNIPELDLYRGQSLGLAGNNGAGKTTFFRILLDLIEADSGEVVNSGIPVAKSEEWKNFTGSFLDEGFLIDYLSPDEYFNFIGRLHGISKAELNNWLSRWDELFKGEIRGVKKYIRNLSKGNQKKVGIVGALIGNPKVVLLDEPFANLDPSTQYSLRDMLKELDRESETTLLISSHDLVHIADFCDRIIILDRGEIVKDIRNSSETLEELQNFFVRKIRGEEAEN